MRRTAAEAEETRQAVLRAALRVFSTQGYAATTLEQVAQAAGVTRGSIYWHFANKAELYRALIQSFAGRSGPIMAQAAAEGGGFLDVCRRILVRLLTSLEDDAELRAVTELTLFQTERTAELADVNAEMAQATQTLVEMLASIMRQGITSGALRVTLDPEDVARAFLAYQQGLFHLWLSYPDAFSLRERASALADIFIEGIAA